MLVMFDVADPRQRAHTMTPKGESRSEVLDLKGLLARDEDLVRGAVGRWYRRRSRRKMTEAIGAANGERTLTRLGYRSG